MVLLVVDTVVDTGTVVTELIGMVVVADMYQKSNMVYKTIHNIYIFLRSKGKKSQDSGCYRNVRKNIHVILRNHLIFGISDHGT